MIKMEKVLIYGAGEVGKLLGKILKDQHVEVECYLVSKGYKKNDSLNGINVEEYDLEKNVVLTDTVLGKTVYLTTKQDSQKIKQSLESGGYNVVMKNSDSDFCKIYESYFENVLKRNSRNGIENDILQFDKFFVLNPRKQSLDYQLSFYMETEDLLCPALQDTERDYCEGPYELENVILKENDVVIDCGSNIGLFSLHAASKGCKVYAFEPDKKNRLLLEQVCKQFEKNIHISEKALGSYCGYANFEVDCAGTGCKIVKNFDEGVVKVPITTLDQYVKENNISRIDFIKADIEGAEREMLMGARTILKEMGPKLSICTYHLPDDKEVLENIILEANSKYIVKHAYKKLYAYIPHA